MDVLENLQAWCESHVARAVGKYHPRHLPPIDRVEVIVLNGSYFRERPPDAFLNQFRVEAVVVVEKEAAQQIAYLWRMLPSGSQARCHIPPFGLRFIANEKVCVEASLCWGCNNIWLLLEGQETQHCYQFDGTENVSLRLLNLLKELTGTT